MLPGTHTLSIGFFKTGGAFYNFKSTIDRAVTFDGQTGHRYILGERYSYSQWTPTLRDIVTGERLYPPSDRAAQKVLQELGISFVNDDPAYRGADGVNQPVPRSKGAPIAGLNEQGAYVLRGVITEDTLAKILGAKPDPVRSKILVSSLNEHRIAVTGPDGRFIPGQLVYLVDEENILVRVEGERTFIYDDLNDPMTALKEVNGRYVPEIDDKPILGYCATVPGGAFILDPYNRVYFVSGPGGRVIDLKTAAVDSLPDVAKLMQETLKRLNFTRIDRLAVVRTDDGSIQLAINGSDAGGKAVTGILKVPAEEK
jgi:CBS domain-containing protein